MLRHWRLARFFLQLEVVIFVVALSDRNMGRLGRMLTCPLLTYLVTEPSDQLSMKHRSCWRC